MDETPAIHKPEPVAALGILTPPDVSPISDTAKASFETAKNKITPRIAYGNILKIIETESHMRRITKSAGDNGA